MLFTRVWVCVATDVAMSLTQIWIAVAHYSRQDTYKVSHIDTDTSHEKIVDLPQLAVPTRLQQFNLLWERAHGLRFKVMRTVHISQTLKKLN